MEKESQPNQSFFHKLTSNKSLNINIIILLIIFLVIFIRNFPFGTFYTGWDNLHPEFNFLSNFKRALSAVWQENQGLGTYGGHGYAATLPHTIMLFLMSFLIPMKYLRASFTFLTLLIGTVGVFFLLIRILKNNLTMKQFNNETIVYNAALFGALFYLLNFATVQNYYIQLEAFIVHFAALPWLFLTLINFLSNSSKKNLLIFALVSLLSTTQGFIPPLFFVYLILLSIFLFFYVIIGKSFNHFKKAFLILAITFFINSYWLLPVLHYSATQSQTYLNSYNNLTSTEDFILKNKKYGDLKDLVFLKGFLTETIDNNEAGNTFYIFEPWTKHLDQKTVQFIGYLFFLIILIGLGRLIKDRKKAYNLAIFTGFLITFSFLATDTPPFSFISKILQEFPITKQAFRVAFTKFSISMAFFYAIAFGLGIYTILNFLFHKTKIQKEQMAEGEGLPTPRNEVSSGGRETSDRIWRKNILNIIVFVLLIYSALPIFTGNFLYQRTKLNIPNNYFELFDFFKNQDKHTRIANFPMGWHWGWSNYRWGYSGSGFLWYGIEQPIMDRAFDVWGKYNENYYWEASYAIYSDNFPLFEKILDKYQISWLLVDDNILPYPNVKGFLYSDKLNDYINKSPKFSLEKVFKSNDKKTRDIRVYKVNLNTAAQDFHGTKNLKNIGPVYDFTNYDQAYDNYGSYYSDDNKIYNIYFPFRSIFSNRETGKLNFQIKNINNNIDLRTSLPKDMNGYVINTPTDDKYINLNKSLEVKNNEMDISIFRKSELYSYNSKNDADFIKHNKSNCNPFLSQGYFDQQIIDQNILRFTSVNSENCYSIILNNLPQRLAYLIQIESRNLKGNGLQFSAINHDSKKSDIEISLNAKTDFIDDFVVVPPMKSDGTGYTLNFNNISIGDQTTINELKNISLTPFPFEFLSNINLTNSDTQTNDKIFVYYQSYNPFWKAFVINNGKWQELKDHVLVNNWANGWKLNNLTIQQFNNSTIILLFWPQYLEYLGFFLLIISFVFIFLKRFPKNS